MCACVSFISTCVQMPEEVRVSDPLELELQAGNLQGTETRSSERALHALNHGAISLVSSTA